MWKLRLLYIKGFFKILDTEIKPVQSWPNIMIVAWRMMSECGFVSAEHTALPPTPAFGVHASCMCVSLMKTISGRVWSCAAFPIEEAGVSGAGGCDSVGQACNQTHELDKREPGGIGWGWGWVTLKVSTAVKTDQILPVPLISTIQHAIALKPQSSQSQLTNEDNQDRWITLPSLAFQPSDCSVCGESTEAGNSLVSI